MDSQIPLRDVLFHPIATAIKWGTSPIYPLVSYDAQSYINRTPVYKIVKKFLHKYLVLLLRRQMPLMRFCIDPKDKVLVLYTGKDSFGDSNLELCGRAMIKDKGYKIDLLTLPKLAPQFKEDDVFGSVFTNIQQLEISQYNVVLLAEFNHRSLRLKCKYFGNTPLACLFGFFDGPPRSQASFSYAAFNRLYNLGLSDKVLLAKAKPYLCCSRETMDSIESILPKGNFCVISVGGVDPYRTYEHWGTLLKLLDAVALELNIKSVVLVGSSNGEADAKRLCSTNFLNVDLFNFVGQLSLLQTRAVILRARVFTGCDGGLMHVTHSTDTPTVTLFSDKEPHQYWLTPACRSLPLQSSGKAGNIAPGDILRALTTVLAPRNESVV